MGLENLFHTVSLTLQVFILNLLLSGDNAVVIALACRSQPPLLMRRAMSIGIGAAIALRILLTTVAGLLLQVPMLKLAGGVALTIIAVKLTIAKSGGAESGESASGNPQALWPIVGTIIAADLVMSVDNVVALAAVAQGNIFFLALGLLMCVPLLIYGSVFVTALLKRYPLLIRGGGAMLGWIAGDIAITDPMIADWVNQQSPAWSSCSCCSRAGSWRGPKSAPRRCDRSPRSRSPRLPSRRQSPPKSPVPSTWSAYRTRAPGSRCGSS
jgi:YjbE family integral membrane protein